MPTCLNWPITRPGTSASATAAGTRVSLRQQQGDDQRTDVLIDNPGPLDVYVLAGDDTVQASTATAMRVPAASLQPYSVGTAATHISLVTTGGSQAVVVHQGAGA